MNTLSRITRRSLSILVAVLIFALPVARALAQDAQPEPTWSQDETTRIAKEIRSNIAQLNYGVFDWITFGFRGKTVVVKGYAALPALKSGVDNVLKNIKGIEKVDNQIEVLPLSLNDDRIREAVYNRIYTASSLRKYNANQGSARKATGPGRSVAQAAGGITNDPPRGFHAIHIIVKNGNVILFGVVNHDMESDIAEIQANSAPGVFSVDNQLDVPEKK